MNYLWVIITLILTVCGQLLLKVRLTNPSYEKIGFSINFFIKAFTDVYILLAFLLAFLGSLTWMVALTKFKISKIYPSLSLIPILVLVFSAVLLNEEVTKGKVIGLMLIIVGSVLSFKL